MIFPNLCRSCKHLNRPVPEDEFPSCAAFPKGIVDPVWEGTWDHFNSLFGESVLYEMEPGMEEVLMGYIQFWYDESP